ncbi:hypothetical protein [Desulfitibacter alkalitolerans]|uniref:hypothetical protein n=1 Tax=Desulfitibacter alkalitolerans TaxID=264641 RepID=UPI00047F1AD7|nr:hypothetical protein [Desulfitibacter alkalitolerans]
MHTLSTALSKKQSNRWSKFNRLSLLILGLVLLYFFVAVGLPFLSQLVGFSEAHQVIIDEKIEAGAWFYIFVEQMREIEPRVRHTLQYTPGTDKSD